MLENSRRRKEKQAENCSGSQLSWAKALSKDDGSRLLVIRKHKHLIKPYINDNISRPRSMTHGTYTVLGLMGCMFIGYSYARLQKDEVLRRRYYSRYSNCMSLFDYVTPIFEQYSNRLFEWAINFDSMYSLWYFKT